MWTRRVVTGECHARGGAKGTGPGVGSPCECPPVTSQGHSGVSDWVVPAPRTGPDTTVESTFARVVLSSLLSPKTHPYARVQDRGSGCREGDRDVPPVTRRPLKSFCVQGNTHSRPCTGWC